MSEAISTSAPRSTSVALSLLTLERYVLAGLVVFLPLLEAPKNLLFVVYVALWLFNRYRARDFGGPWCLWDTLATTWLASGIAAAAFGGLHHSEWQGAFDLLRYVVLFWLVFRSRYGLRDIQFLFIALSLSTALALGIGWWALHVAHTRTFLELNSVGHVNHSSIYVALVYGATLAGTLAYWNRVSVPVRLLGLALVLLFAAAIVLMGSRAAIAMLLVVALVSALIWSRRSWRYTIAVVATIFIAFVGATTLKIDSGLAEKQAMYAEHNIKYSFRDVIWHSALEIARRYPVFGVGMNNYSQVDSATLKRYVEECSEKYDPSKYLSTAHAHNLYLNTLAERGIVGLVVLLAVLGAWMVSLVRRLPRRGDSDLDWSLWGAAATAWLVTTGIGVFNTTLHHEHALLTVLLFALWLSRVRNVRT